MNKKNRGTFIITIYSILCLVPLGIFTLDFLTFEGISDVFKTKTLFILKNTLIQSGLSVVFAFFIALLPAIYAAKKNNLLSKLSEMTIFIPFFFPPVSAGVAISLLLKDTGLNYTLFAVVLAHVFYNTPILVRYISESLKTVDSETIYAARIDGAGEFTIFFKIIIPQIYDGILKGAFLAFTYCFMSFAVILSVGPVKYSTFETAIAGSLSESLDISRAISYVIIQFIIIALVNISLPQNNESSRSYTKQFSGKKHYISGLSALLFFIFEAGIVIYTLGFSFFNPQTGVFDPLPFARILSADFNKTFPVVISIANSFVISCISAFTATAISYCLLSIRNNITDKILLLSMGISGAMTGLVLYYMNIRFGIPFFILIIAGITFLTVPIGYSFMYDNVKHFNRELIDTAAIDGAGRMLIFRYIQFPLLKTTLIGTLLQLFTVAFGEFTLTYTMKIQNSIPISSVVNYNIGSKRLFRESAAMSTINIMIVLLVFIISSRVTKKEKD